MTARTKKRKHTSLWSIIFRPCNHNLKNKKNKAKLFNMRNVFPFSMACDVSIALKSLKSCRTSCHSNISITLSNQLKKRIQKQGINHRSIITLLKKTFHKSFNIFTVFEDTRDNFIRTFSLHWAGDVHKNLFNFVCKLCS